MPSLAGLSALNPWLALLPQRMNSHTFQITVMGLSVEPSFFASTGSLLKASRIVNLGQKLLRSCLEYSLWAVTGLQRLKARGEFVIPGSSMTEVSRYRAESNPVQLWVKNTCKGMMKAKAGGPKISIRSSLKDWSKDNGFQADEQLTFGKKLRALGFEHRKSGDDFYWNLKWKDESSHQNPGSAPSKKYGL